MKWKNKKDAVGDRKITKHFAWLPVELSDGSTIWLERYQKIWAYKQWYTYLIHMRIEAQVHGWVCDKIIQ